MSLMQLLAMGKSIGTIQDRPTPYKMRPQNLLPKFGASWPENVRDPEPESHHTDAAAKTEPTFAFAKASPPSAESKFISAKEVGPSSEPSGDTPKQAQPTPVAGGASRAAYPLGRWTSLARSAGWKPRERDGAAVQAELGLDLVRVVRNDLSESDLEVVPAKVRSEMSIKSGRVFWRQLCTRWFRWGRA